QFSKLLRVRGREIIGLRKVLLDVVEFPLLLVGIEAAAHRLPRRERKRGGHPAVVIEAAIGSHLEGFRRVALLALGINERIVRAGAFDGISRGAFKYSWWGAPVEGGDWG